MSKTFNSSCSMPRLRQRYRSRGFVAGLSPPRPYYSLMHIVWLLQTWLIETEVGVMICVSEGDLRRVVRCFKTYC